MQNVDCEDIERSLVAYLTSRPRASDTLDGIVSWWLPLQQYVTERERIEAALARLVALDILRCERRADGTELYALEGRLPPSSTH